MNKVVVVVFWEYDVFELYEPTVVSFPQKVVYDDSLSVEFFFRQTASEATSCLYLGDVNHLDASSAILLWLMNSVSQDKNTPIVRKDKIGVKLKLISSVDFRVLTRRKSVASY